MQTLYKPSRRVYDTKAIEACHDDGTDEHDNFHLGASIAIGVGVAVLPAPAKVGTRLLIGASAAAVAYLAEAEEAIAHAAEEVWDSIADHSSTPGRATGPSRRAASHDPNDPHKNDHNNAQSGSY